MIVPGRRSGDIHWRPAALPGFDGHHVAAPAGDHECSGRLGGRDAATVGELDLVDQSDPSAASQNVIRLPRGQDTASSRPL